MNLNSHYNTSTETVLCLCVQVILLVAFACVRSTWYTSVYSYGFFEGVTLGYSITVAVFLFLTVFGVPKRASFVNWTIAVSIVTYNNCYSISDHYSYKSSQVNDQPLTDNVLGLLIHQPKIKLV